MDVPIDVARRSMMTMCGFESGRAVHGEEERGGTSLRVDCAARLDANPLERSVKDDDALTTIYTIRICRVLSSLPPRR
jgi:hypothetical protein